MTLSSNQINRIKLDFKEIVRIPDEFKIYFWEYEDYTYLEILIKRVFTYGNFGGLKRYIKCILKRHIRLVLNILK